MLRRLMDIHDELLARIAALRDLAGAPLPQRMAVAGERWRLSTAMGLHARLVDEEVYPLLMRRLDANDRALIVQFRADGLILRMALRHHVERWTADRVFDDWDAYRASLPHILARSDRRIRDEKYILYPLIRHDPAVPAAVLWQTLPHR